MWRTERCRVVRGVQGVAGWCGASRALLGGAGRPERCRVVRGVQSVVGWCGASRAL